MKNSKALVIFSGGQDSTTCLAWAKNRYNEVEAITFNYGQKHSVELIQAIKICHNWCIKQHIVDISFFGQIVDSALTSNGDVTERHSRLKELPASFVPNRNAMFITIAHALAQKIGTEVLIGGMCETDYSGYPDCRRNFIDKIELTLNIGSNSDIEIITPLMKLDKAQTFQLAEKENCLEDVLEHSHTCYNGDRENRWEWGYGCDNCPACELRKRGWEKYKSLK